MADREIKTFLVGDSSSLESAMSRAGRGASTMAGDLQSAEGKAKSFGSAMDQTGQAVGNTESTFMGTADLLDGLGGAFGLPTEGATNMMRAFGDLSGGFQVVQGAMSTMTTFMGTQMKAALSMIAAHPIIFAVTALTAAFIAAYTQSETFRNFINGLAATLGGAVMGAFTAVKNAAVSVWNWITSTWAGLTNVITNPFTTARDVVTTAFNAMIGAFKSAWNVIARFISGLDFTIDVPDILPGPDEYTIGMPDIPTLRHSGGVVPGAPGSQVPIMALAGEYVSPRGATSGGGVVINVAGSVITDRDLGRVVADALRNNRLVGVS